MSHDQRYEADYPSNRKERRHVKLNNQHPLIAKFELLHHRFHQIDRQRMDTLTQLKHQDLSNAIFASPSFVAEFFDVLADYHHTLSAIENARITNFDMKGARKENLYLRIFKVHRWPQLSNFRCLLMQSTSRL